MLETNIKSSELTFMGLVLVVNNLESKLWKTYFNFNLCVGLHITSLVNIT